MNIILDASAKRDRMSELEESLLIHSTLLSASILLGAGVTKVQDKVSALMKLMSNLIATWKLCLQSNAFFFLIYIYLFGCTES